MNRLGAYALVSAMPKRPKAGELWEAEAAKITANYPLFDKSLLSDWRYTYENARAAGIGQANARLKKLQKLFKFGDFRIDNTEDEKVNDYAKAKAIQCMRLISAQETEAEQLEAVRSILYAHGVDNKQLKQMYTRAGYASILLRAQCQDWWRRRIRRAAARGLESIARELNLVNRLRSIYCSPLGTEEFKRCKQLNFSMMESTILENEEGERWTLADLADISTANPAIRRAELMTRIAGFEMHAKEQGFEGWFFTVTCPSKYHSAHSFGGRNSKFNGASPRQAQEYLNRIWQRFRAKADRAGWEYFGFRVAEPHHDATPHWHLLLFINPAHALQFGGALRAYALAEDGQEAGAFEARFKAEKIKTGINHETGREYSAAGYIAKYISKNIDGEGVEKDLYEQDAKASAINIAAWASRNGIRQFQQCGGPSVGGWRELRRISQQSEEQQATQPALLREAAKQIKEIGEEDAAKAWAWYCRFSEQNGKISVWRIMKAVEEVIEYIDEETGELHKHTMEKPVFNKYRELVEKNHGLRLMTVGGDVYAQTRFHQWQVISTEKSQAAEVREMRKAERQARAEYRENQRAQRENSGANAPPWSSINNCTPENLILKKLTTETNQLEMEM